MSNTLSPSCSPTIREILLPQISKLVVSWLISSNYPHFTGCQAPGSKTWPFCNQNIASTFIVYIKTCNGIGKLAQDIMTSPSAQVTSSYVVSHGMYWTWPPWVYSSWGALCHYIYSLSDICANVDTGKMNIVICHMHIGPRLCPFLWGEQCI